VVRFNRLDNPPSAEAGSISAAAYQFRLKVNPPPEIEYHPCSRSTLGKEKGIDLLEEWTTVRYLKAQGLGTRKIARQLGFSRNKVRRALLWDRQPRYERPPRPNPQLERFRGVVSRMLAVDHFIGSRILKEILKQGYGGSQTAFCDFLANIKAEASRSKACIRHETALG
jgi:hypothetical protein